MYTYIRASERGRNRDKLGYGSCYRFNSMHIHVDWRKMLLCSWRGYPSEKIHYIKGPTYV